MPGAPYKPFDPFAGATEILPLPPRADPSAPPYSGEIPPPGYNTLFTEKFAIVESDPSLRETSTHRLVIGVIPRISEVEPSVPDL